MNIYVSGIGGVGMGPLALIARDLGWNVCGSDLVKSRYSDTIEAANIKVYIGQDGSQITDSHRQNPIDWFVYSSALPENHPELRFAREHNIKASKRDEFINTVVQEKNLKLIAVSGTHGKTTTTGMLIWLFKRLGVPVSYSIGTNISFGPSGQYRPGSQYFVYEADEFDRNFLSFEPYAALIPALDYDHPDTYPELSEYKRAFRQFIDQSAWIYTWQSIRHYLGLEELPNLYSYNDHDEVMSAISLPGHNKRNGLLACKCLADILDIPLQKSIETINNFPGTERRFEKLADNLYTDYAHHPTEIKSTIKMAQELNSNIVVVYQPHQNIRQHELLKTGGYDESFVGAKKVYWLPAYLSREYQELETIPPEQLIATLSDPSLAEIANLDEELIDKIQSHRQNGDLVLCMSAGSLDAWLRAQIKNS